MNTLHIGTEMSWRGGENQIRYLMEGLKRQGHKTYFAYPKGSQAIARLSADFPSLELPSKQGWDPRSILRLRTFCIRNQIDIIDAHSSGAHALGLSFEESIAPAQTRCSSTG